MWQALWNNGMPLVQWGVVIGASLAAAVWDVAKRRIPNILTGPTFVAGLAFACLRGQIWGLLDSLSASIMLATPYLLLFLFASGGAGDAKLMGAVGAWLGIINGAVALFSVAFAGIILAVGFAISRRLGLKIQARSAAPTTCRDRGSGRKQDPARPAQQQGKRAEVIPFALAIFFGVCIAAVGVSIWRM
ncbi:MAG: A24 family peptidase [Planctomycetota bacterium]|jgi:prepilin peptidase CpaA